MKKNIILVSVILSVIAMGAIGFVAIAQGGKFFKFADSPTVYKAYSSQEEFLKDGGNWDDIQLFGEKSFGSIQEGQAYNSTSTASNSTGFLQSVNPLLIKTGFGTLGSVIITKAGSAGGRVNFYNATTTNVNLRTGQPATSSIIITSLPTDLAAGTYTFDLAFSAGLIMDSTGTVGTSTITYR